MIFQLLLAKALAGQLRPISVAIEDLEDRRVAWLPQQSHIDHSFPISVQDMVMLGQLHEFCPFGQFTAAHRRTGQEALANVSCWRRWNVDQLAG